MNKQRILSILLAALLAFPTPLYAVEPDGSELTVSDTEATGGETEATGGGTDAASSDPDAVDGGTDAASSDPDAADGSTDAASSDPDAADGSTDAASSDPDAASSDPDAADGSTDAASSETTGTGSAATGGGDESGDETETTSNSATVDNITYTYEEYHDGVRIVSAVAGEGFTGNSIVIPETLNGLPVRRIQHATFAYLGEYTDDEGNTIKIADNITSITLPSTLVSCGASFEWLNNITEVIVNGGNNN